MAKKAKKKAIRRPASRGKRPKKAKPRRARTAKPRRKPAAKPARPAKPPKAERPRPVPAVRPAREEFEEETVCSLEFLSDGRSFVARLDTTRGGMREHKAPSFTDLLELVAEDLREEFLEA